MPSIRAEQMAADIQKRLSELISTKVRDPRVGFVTVTQVRVTDDLSFARVFFSDLSKATGGESQSREGLEKAKGFLRSELGKMLRARHVPELRFIEDDSADRGMEMDRLLDGLNIDKSAPEEAPPGDEEDS